MKSIINNKSTKGILVFLEIISSGYIVYSILRSIKSIANLRRIINEMGDAIQKAALQEMINNSMFAIIMLLFVLLVNIFAILFVICSNNRQVINNNIE